MFQSPVGSRVIFSTFLEILALGHFCDLDSLPDLGIKGSSLQGDFALQVVCGLPWGPTCRNADVQEANLFIKLLLFAN